jgi:hypothetical protein
MEKLRNQERAQLLESVVLMLHSWKGQQVKVIESISRRPPSQDRHCCTRSVHVLTLENAMWAISGGRLMVIGSGDVGYEVAFDIVGSVEVTPDRIVLTEKFGAEAERITDLRRVDAPKA